MPKRQGRQYNRRSHHVCGKLSWDGGVAWMAAQTTPTPAKTEQTDLLGGSADTWGRTWTPAQLGDSNFRARITDIAGNIARDFLSGFGRGEGVLQAVAAGVRSQESEATIRHSRFRIRHSAFRIPHSSFILILTDTSRRVTMPLRHGAGFAPLYCAIPGCFACFET